MATQSFQAADILQMSQGFRRNFVNCLAGFKSLNLVGTHSSAGVENLGLFNSCIHVGANPPLLGLLFRPESVERHTLQNFRATGHCTLNHVRADGYRAAHHASAKYPPEVSEFEACGLHPFYSEAHSAPYVAEAALQIGLSYSEEHLIAANATVFVVGQVEEVRLPEGLLLPDGYIDLEAADTLTGTGLDGYHRTQLLERLAYARPGEAIAPLPEPKPRVSS